MISAKGKIQRKKKGDEWRLMLGGGVENNWG